MMERKWSVFSGDGGEAFAQIEAHLVTKDAESSRAGAVFFGYAIVENVLH